MTPASPLLTEVLEQVSRTFYKTLWVLPRAVRPQISLAYLLARASDTIADTEMVPLEQRLGLLRCFRERVAGARREPLDLAAMAAHQGTPGERTLMERLEEALAILESLSEDDRQRVRTVLDIITSGQELDLRRFSSASAGRIVALNDDAELDDYTYRVAGCVGEFWTGMCQAHLFGAPRGGAAEFIKLGVRFGRGLQLVNILRDLPGDLRSGRCYVPVDKLRAAGLAPADLLQPDNEPRFRRLYQGYLDQAQAHLAAGWEYTNQVPYGCWRVRLACALPILIGARTLALLRAGNVLDPGRRIKVPRTEVKGMVRRLVLSLAAPPLWRNLYARASAAD